ncbi:MAG: hypothetical protein ACRC5R_01065, partial [Mycoplasmatales bacterium]
NLSTDEAAEERGEKKAKEDFSYIKENFFEFNEKDFTYEGSYGGNKEGSFTMNYTYNPITTSKYIKMGGGHATTTGKKDSYISPYWIAKQYLTTYVFNDLLVDRKLGNKLDEMFLELEKEGIEYYIQRPFSDKKFYIYKESPGGSNSEIDRLKPGLEVPIGTTKEIEELLKSDGFDVTDPDDMKKYMDIWGFFPIIRIKLNTDKYNENDLSKLNEWAKEYYNSDVLQIEFIEIFNYEYNCVSEYYGYDEYCGRIVGYDFNGYFVEDFKEGYVKRENPNYEERFSGGLWLEDENGAVYKWTEVPK